MAGDVLAGSVSVFWEPDSLNGMTEYVFTRPAFRGRGLASALLTESLRYLKEHGLQTATLEVKADNESALGLYRALGNVIAQESRVYEVTLPALTLSDRPASISG
jgi:GNAT superfamily N-acetyltransferase